MKALTLLFASTVIAGAAAAAAGAPQDGSPVTRLVDEKARIDTEQPATATPESEQARSLFAHIDADADGNISAAEASGIPAVSDQFEKADANYDGVLSEEEFVAVWGRPANNRQS